MQLKQVDFKSDHSNSGKIFYQHHNIHANASVLYSQENTKTYI